MKVLIACEFSGIVRDAFIEKGHDAISCDLLPTEREGPHIQDNVLDHLNENWDLMVAHPPCTYLSIVGNKHMKNNVEREIKRQDAFNFFMQLINADIPRICVENPVGYINTHYRKPDQIIHPYYFGEQVQKRTCLWLKNLPLLKYNKPLNKPEPLYICQGERCKGKKINWVEGIKGVNDRSKERSKSFVSIANAMVKQWGDLPIIDKEYYVSPGEKNLIKEGLCFVDNQIYPENQTTIKNGKRYYTPLW